MDLPMRRIWQLWTLLLWPDAREAAHPVAQTQLAIVEAVRVGLALALALATLVGLGAVLVPGRRLGLTVTHYICKRFYVVLKCFRNGWLPVKTFA